MSQGQDSSSFHTVRTNSYRSQVSSSRSPSKPTHDFHKKKSMGKVELEAATESTSKLEGTVTGKEEDSFREDFEERTGGEGRDKDGLPDRFSIESCFRKGEVTPSSLQDKGRLVGKGKGEVVVDCMVTYGGKTVGTDCRLTAGELHFQKAGLVLRLGKITKLKVTYQCYQRCIWITYQQTRSTLTPQAKFKLHIPNDIKDDLYLLFSKIIVQKLTLISFDIDQNQGDDEQADRFIMAGELLKKSQFFGKWAARKIVITDRIESYKCSRCTFEMKNIREIWTRFDVVEQCLVLKVRHGSEKTELALPIVNYPARFCRSNWMYRIYRLLSASLT